MAIINKHVGSATKPIGILGGTFDPIHLGHVHLAKQVKRLAGLNFIYIIPCHQSSLRKPPQAAALDRLEMTKLAVEKFKFLQVYDREILTPKISYTINTLRKLRLKHSKEPLALIMGIDAFNNFHRWKDYLKILKLSHLIIVNRPKFKLTENKILSKLLNAHQVTKPTLLANKLSGYILFLKIKPLPVSATNIRNLIAKKTNAKKFLAKNVWAYLKQRDIYN